jgi:hypothetical protein
LQVLLFSCFYVEGVFEMKRCHLFQIVALVAVLIASAGQVQAAVITVGSNDGGNCYPFSCFASDSGTTYQQVYDASQFSGLSQISAISFFRSSGGVMDSADYQIKFSTTSAAVNGLSTDWALNIGPDSSIFGNYSLSGTMPTKLTFAGTPFVYDPTAGNLLMTVQVSNATFSAGYDSFFMADYTGVVTSRLYALNNSNFGVTGTGALVTEFQILDGSVVPEPASIAIFALGSIGMAYRARRKSKCKA